MLHASKHKSMNYYNMNRQSMCELSKFEKDNIFYKSLVTEKITIGGKNLDIHGSQLEDYIILPSLPKIKIRFNIINDDEEQCHDSLFNIFSMHLNQQCLEYLNYTIQIHKCKSGCFELTLECLIFNSSVYHDFNTLFPSKILKFEDIEIDFIIDESKNKQKVLTWNELFNYFDEEKFCQITNFQDTVLEPINQIFQLCFYKLQCVYPFVFDSQTRKVFAANYASIKEISSLFSDKLKYETKLIRKLHINSLQSRKIFPQFEIFKKKGND